jgi:hypothetical protein
MTTNTTGVTVELDLSVRPLPKFEKAIATDLASEASEDGDIKKLLPSSAGDDEGDTDDPTHSE